MQKKKLAAAIGTGMLLALATGCGETKINLNNYIDVSFSGIDMKGTAQVTVDYDELTKAVNRHVGSIKDLTTLYNAIDEIQVSPNQSENLRNGDTVKVACSYNNNIIKSYKLIFTYSEIEKKVSDLETSKPVSAETLLDAVTISYDGVAPYAEAVIESADNPYSGFVGYNLSDAYDLDNGDTFTLSLNVDEYYAEQQGYVVIGADEATKEITVSDLPQYCATYDDVSDETVTQLKAQSVDVVEAWKADATYNSTFSATEPQRVVFLSAKDTESNSTANRLIFIYKTTETSRSGSQDYYIATESDNIIRNGDGTNQVKVSDLYVADYDETYDDLYNQVVKKRLADYNVTEYEY